MAPLNRQHHQHQNYNQVFSGSMYHETKARGSKSQMCLHKILAIITTVPPPLAAASPQFSDSGTKEYSSVEDYRVSETDLNVGEAKTNLNMLIEAAELVFGDYKEDHGTGFEHESGPSKSKILAFQSRNKTDSKDEAAPADDEATGRKPRWQGAATAPSSAVVRSKRVRTQVLPYKYRDSVLLEPLTRLSNRGGLR